MAQRAHVALRNIGQRGETHIRETGALERTQVCCVAWQAVRTHLGFEFDDFTQARDEPWIDGTGFVDLCFVHAHAQGLADDEQAIGCWLA